IDDLGINEEIQSVRWLDDLAIVVTFRQVDPLYTIDLSDPTAPKKLGELKIPGFSAYLHPLGQGQLMGIGVDADDQGRQIGSQLATFDISNPKAVRQVQVARFGQGTELSATHNPKAFTWLPQSRQAITTVSSYQSQPSNQLLIITVAADGTFTQRGGFTHSTQPAEGLDYDVRTLPLPGNRIAVVSRGKVEVIDLSSPER
ncbi:MAG: beta-propeller domain-containing protein, partial [Nocardioidaceae bacterium]|nr:beta-propeller domain-containing protein [Nocardioidaceae bacterium]